MMLNTLQKLHRQYRSRIRVGGFRRFTWIASRRRLEPLSRNWGYERGLPIDRYYIEAFLAEHAGDITGRVMEVKDDTYARRFGGRAVRTVDVLDIDTDNPRATLVGDLTNAETLPANSFDCIVLTQVLQLIYDLPAAIRSLHRSLKPGGVLLLTVPGITQIAYESLGHTWYWAFTEASVRRQLSEVFPVDRITVGVDGNHLAAASLLYGRAAGELHERELTHRDSDYPVIVKARAVKED